MIGKDGITTGADLERVVIPLFNSRYKGIFSWKTPSDLPQLKEGEVALLNKAIHWTAIYCKNGKQYEIDSYNRDLLGSAYIDDKAPIAFRQPLSNADCGTRTIAMLIKEAL